jgi:hypothetical protein
MFRRRLAVAGVGVASLGVGLCNQRSALAAAAPSAERASYTAPQLEKGASGNFDLWRASLRELLGSAAERDVRDKRSNTSPSARAC